jgi:hypothetical protein
MINNQHSHPVDINANESTNGITPKKQDSRQRCQFRFWIEKNERESWIGDELTALKQERRYKATLRDALRLIFDLRAGHTDVLFDLFPAVQVQLERAAISAVEARLDLLEQRVLADRSTVADRPPRPAPGGVVITAGSKASAKTVADNFLRSFSSQFFS